MKYEITDIQHPQNPKLHRIRALKDFGDVKAGDLGGYVQSEKNLSQNGRCWIYGSSIVQQNAHVSKNAKVYGNSVLFMNAMITDKAQVFDSILSGYVTVSDNGRVNYTHLTDYITVKDNAQVYGYRKNMIGGDLVFDKNTDVVIDNGKFDAEFVY